MTSLTAGSADAPAVVLLHGWGASKEIWKLVFRSPLADRYRLIALDLPGTGGVRLHRNATCVDLADWLAEETKRLGISRFAVLGHSMGGNIAVQLAARHRERITAVVLVAPALHSDRMAPAGWRYHEFLWPPALAGARMVAGFAGWVERQLPPADCPGWARGYMRRSGYMMYHNTVPGLRAQLRGLLSTPARLESIPEGVPTLIMHGAKDGRIPLEWSKEALRARPKATRLIVYRQALHCPMDTHTQAFCDDLAAFLDGVARNQEGREIYADTGTGITSPA